MDTKDEKKINQLFQKVPYGAVLISSWLVKNGYNNSLQHSYIKSGWIESIGNGAFKRNGENINIYGAIYSLQNQLEKDIHIGGRSSLSLNNISHYLEVNQKEVHLFSTKEKKLPNWFTEYDWGIKTKLLTTNFISGQVGIIDYEINNLKIKISSPIRSYFECLYSLPKEFDFDEAYKIMESLAWARPKEIQLLLENCKSKKVNRIFLFIAKKVGHSWFDYLNIEKVNLGKGKRVIIENGVLDKEFLITVPKNMKNNE